jgi:hypothetical protein
MSRIVPSSPACPSSCVFVIRSAQSSTIAFHVPRFDEGKGGSGSECLTLESVYAIW